MSEGLVLKGKYRLIALLGEGGMGSVWRAHDSRLDAPIAIKLMHPRAAEDAEGRARFAREASAAAHLRGPHVVQVFDVDIDDATGAPFIAMELLDGMSLRERLAQAGRLPPREVAKIVVHVARALSRAHDAQLVHRDLKPANIFLERNADDEIAKVLDFGIAKWTSRPLGDAATRTGMLLGTPHYMSPEQISSSKYVDHRTDLWSLSVIAVECMTGSLPFSADNLPGLALSICQGRAQLPSQLGPVPRGFDAWFARGTQLDPEQRFQSANELARTLQRCCDDDAAPAALLTRTYPEQSRAPFGMDVQMSSTSLSGTSAPGASAPDRHGVRRRWPWLVAGGVAVLALLGYRGLTSILGAPPPAVEAAPATSHVGPVSGPAVGVPASTRPAPDRVPAPEPAIRPLKSPPLAEQAAAGMPEKPPVSPAPRVEAGALEGRSSAKSKHDDEAGSSRRSPSAPKPTGKSSKRTAPLSSPSTPQRREQPSPQAPAAPAPMASPSPAPGSLAPQPGVPPSAAPSAYDQAY
jgi:eukaryotic-like serine/threonine-protein kinase